MFDFGFDSQERAYLNEPDNNFEQDNRDYDLDFDSRREDDILGRD